MLKKAKAWVALPIRFLWSARLHQKKTYEGEIGPTRKDNKSHWTESFLFWDKFTALPLY